MKDLASSYLMACLIVNTVSNVWGRFVSRSSNRHHSERKDLISEGSGSPQSQLRMCRADKADAGASQTCMSGSEPCQASQGVVVKWHPYFLEWQARFIH